MDARTLGSCARGVPPQTATFTAHAWVAVVRNLRPGAHTIAVDAVSEFAITSTTILDVLPAAHPDDD
jgi:hypothetical protein